MQKGFFIVWGVIAFVVAAAIASSGLLAYKYFSAKNNEQIACTMEAKICPDGSSVGRSAPNCEFAACPDATAGWKTYTNDKYNFSIKYPTDYTFTDKPGNNLGYGFDVQYEGVPFPSPLPRLFNLSVKDKHIDSSSLSVFADNKIGNLDMCLKKYDYTNGTKLVDLQQTKDVNGNKFYIVVEKQGDAAMGGQRGFFSEYRIIHNSYCYIFSLEVGYHLVGYAGVINTGKSDATPEETQAQQAAVEKHEEILDQIISTFKFTK